MNKNDKLEINYNEGLLEEKKEAWMDNLANTDEEAKQMEENFKSSFNGGQLSAINCDNKEYNVMM